MLSELDASSFCLISAILPHSVLSGLYQRRWRQEGRSPHLTVMRMSIWVLHLFQSLVLRGWWQAPWCLHHQLRQTTTMILGKVENRQLCGAVQCCDIITKDLEQRSQKWPVLSFLHQGALESRFWWSIGCLTCLISSYLAWKSSWHEMMTESKVENHNPIQGQDHSEHKQSEYIPMNPKLFWNL